MDEKGQLIKVSIEAYENEDFTKKSKSKPNPIFLPVNPESFTQNFKVELNQQKGQGNQGTNANYKGTKPEELKLDFTFDGTNTIQGYNSKLDKNFNRDQSFEAKPKPVKDQLKIFMDTVYNMKGKIHRPHFLKVHWGKGFKFPCILSNLDLNYTLFEPSGDPLRIKVSATFLNYIAQKERKAREKKKSPDLTHVRQVIAGNRLDLMTYEIYNDSNFVTQIAHANRLTSFRTLRTGSNLVFPPLDKAEV
jgi:nucleoid-associated protein YgaU